MTKTKSFVRFLNRANYLDIDIEFVGIIRASTEAGLLNDKSNCRLFHYLTLEKHPKIAERIVAQRGRNHVAEHLQSTVFEAFIKHLYEDMTQYFREIVHAAARHGLDTSRLVGDHKTEFKANEILLAGSWDKVVSIVAESVFRSFENEKSTLKLLNKLNKKLNLSVPENIIGDALPYLELRHLLVHSDGKIDKKYCDSYPDMELCEGKKLKFTTDFLKKAKSKIIALVKAFDDSVVSNRVVSEADMQP